MTNNNPQRPNLFDYATSELSQDALLCWLLKWADPAYRKFSEALHKAGVDLIRLLSAEKKDKLPERIDSVRVDKQHGYIDVLCTINEKDKDRIAILIEDKKGTLQHSNQLKRYKELVKKKFPEDRILPVYVQTGDQSDYSEACNHGYVVIRRPDLLNGLEKHTVARQESDILDGFIRHLRRIEDDVQSWKSTEPQDWERDAWQGFYMELQSKPLLGGDWGDVNNPTGGFLGYWFGDWTQTGGAELYLQIDHEQRELCFRIAVEEGNDRKALRGYWHRALMVRCKEEGISARKPNFGFGATMTVIKVEPDHWLMVRDGRVDVTATVARLEKCLGVIRDCVDISEEVFSLLTGLWGEIDSVLKEEIPDIPSKCEKRSDVSEETIKRCEDHGLYYPFGSGDASLGVGVAFEEGEERGIFFGVYCDKREHRELYMELEEALQDVSIETPVCFWPCWAWADRNRNLWSISRENREFLGDEEARRNYAKSISQDLNSVWDAIKRADLA